MFSRSSVLAVLDLHELSLVKAISSIMEKFEKTKNINLQMWKKIAILYF